MSSTSSTVSELSRSEALSPLAVRAVAVHQKRGDTYVRVILNGIVGAVNCAYPSGIYGRPFDRFPVIVDSPGVIPVRVEPVGPHFARHRSKVEATIVRCIARDEHFLLTLL